jgi:hypothetical protein
MTSRDLYCQVREMLERGWDAYTIADRLGYDPGDIQIIVALINNLLT